MDLIFFAAIAVAAASPQLTVWQSAPTTYLVYLLLRAVQKSAPNHRAKRWRNYREREVINCLPSVVHSQ